MSHLLKYAKEDDYNFENVESGVGARRRADRRCAPSSKANQVSVSRNYIGGPTVRADADKLRQVFTNIIDNAIDAMESNAGERRLEFAIQQQRHPGMASVRDSRQRMRYRGRQAREDFQSVLHHQDKRHRARDGHREESDRLASRSDRSAQQTRRTAPSSALDSARRRGARAKSRRASPASQSSQNESESISARSDRADRNGLSDGAPRRH